MKITKIMVEDYLGLKRFKVDDLGKVNLIRGDNGFGKSAILKAIQEAFQSSGHDLHLIHKDADKAEILISLDNGMDILRKISKAGNNVKVVEDGKPLNKPQAVLKAILGETAFNFDPTAFVLEKPSKRREMLLRAIDFKTSPDTIAEEVGDPELLQSAGVDLDGYNYNLHGIEVLEAIQKDLYECRAEQNRDVTRLNKALEQDRKDMPESVDPDKWKDFDYDAKMAELEAGNEIITEHEHDQKELGRLRGQAKEAANEVLLIEGEIKRLEAKKAEKQGFLDGLNLTGMELRKKIEEFKSPDVQAMGAEMKEYTESQKLIGKLEEMDKRQRELEVAQGVHAGMDRLYKILTTKVPRAMMQNINLPVADLTIEGDDIMVGGIQLEKMCTAEQVKFALNIARLLAGELKVICIDDFEHLSEKNRKIFIDEAQGDEFEYFIAQVSDDDSLNMEKLPEGQTKKTEVGVQ